MQNEIHMTTENTKITEDIIMSSETEATPLKTSRVRNAEVSKKSILWAAQEALSKKGYDEVGLREIALSAQIDPALIIRYFGSKEGLFREVIKTHLHLDGLTGIEVKDYPEVLARLVLADSDEVAQHSMLILHRSAASEIAGPIIREALQERLVRPIVAKLNIRNATERVELVMALLGGLSTGRHVTCYPSLKEGNKALLTSLVTPLLRELLTDPN